MRRTEISRPCQRCERPPNALRQGIRNLAGPTRQLDEMAAAWHAYSEVASALAKLASAVSSPVHAICSLMAVGPLEQRQRPAYPAQFGRLARAMSPSLG
jgi:hypothetical protein